MFLAAKTSVDEICYFCTELDSVPHNILIKKLEISKSIGKRKADWEADWEVMGTPENTAVTEASSDRLCFCFQLLFLRGSHWSLV